MAAKTLAEGARALAVKHALKMLREPPEESIPQLIDWAKKFDKDGVLSSQIGGVEAVLDDPNWSRYIKSLWTDIDEGVRMKIFENFIVNSALIGMPRQQKVKDEHGCSVPWAILMDPTSACNLHCTGCWAAEYGNRLNLTYEEMDDIVNQANADGHLHVPLHRRRAAGAQEGRHTLVRGAQRLRVLCLHQRHADRRGVRARDAAREELRARHQRGGLRGGHGRPPRPRHLRRRGARDGYTQAHKLPFGISCCYTSRNADVIGSEEYFDQMVDWGAKFAWFFTYMPVGKNAVPELMVSADQRAFMYRRIREFRHTKPIFTMDFWNDGEFVGGCIAGARSYLHINAAGDIEPCAFIHYADSNIREKTLLEAYKSPLFMAYHKNQPFNCNHLRPCPLLDNPDALKRMVHESGARSTDVEAPEDVDVLTDKCREKAEKWAVKAGELWQESHPQAGGEQGL